MTKCLAGLLVAAAAVVGTAAPEPQSIDPKRGCRLNPAVVGPCFKLHGRLSVGNGTPSMRIWRIGTKRILGVLPSETEIVPEVVRANVEFQTNLYGDFEVCPFERERPGAMQTVCVESASNLVAERFIVGKATPEIVRIRR
jgi:hypothetical protein